MSQPTNWPGQPVPDPQQPAPVYPPAGAPQPAGQPWTPQAEQPAPGQPYMGQPAAPYGAQPAAAPFGAPAAVPYGAQPVAARPAIDFSKISIFEWLVMGGGLLAFIFSFLPAFKFTGFTCSGTIMGVNVCDEVNSELGYLFNGASTSVNAWALFVAWAGALLLLFAAAAMAAKVFANLRQAMLPLITLALAGLGFVLVLLGLFVNPTNSEIKQGLDEVNSLGINIGLKWTREVGYWLMLICAIAVVVGAVMLYLDEHKAAAPQPVYGGFAPQAAPGFAQPYAAPAPQPQFPTPPQFPQAAAPAAPMPMPEPPAAMPIPAPPAAAPIPAPPAAAPIPEPPYTQVPPPPPLVPPVA